MNEMFKSTSRQTRKKSHKFPQTLDLRRNQHEEAKNLTLQRLYLLSLIASFEYSKTPGRATSSSSSSTWASSINSSSIIISAVIITDCRAVVEVPLINFIIRALDKCEFYHNHTCQSNSCCDNNNNVKSISTKLCNKSHFKLTITTNK